MVNEYRMEMPEEIVCEVVAYVKDREFLRKRLLQGTPRQHRRPSLVSMALTTDLPEEPTPQNRSAKLIKLLDRSNAWSTLRGSYFLLAASIIPYIVLLHNQFVIFDSVVLTFTALLTVQFVGDRRSPPIWTGYGRDEPSVVEYIVALFVGALIILAVEARAAAPLIDTSVTMMSKRIYVTLLMFLLAGIAFIKATGFLAHHPRNWSFSRSYWPSDDFHYVEFVRPRPRFYPYIRKSSDRFLDKDFVVSTLALMWIFAISGGFILSILVVESYSRWVVGVFGASALLWLIYRIVFDSRKWNEVLRAALKPVLEDG